MSNKTVNMKYIKDENEEIISPITSVNSIYDETGEGYYHM